MKRYNHYLAYIGVIFLVLFTFLMLIFSIVEPQLVIKSNLKLIVGNDSVFIKQIITDKTYYLFQKQSHCILVSNNEIILNELCPNINFKQLGYYQKQWIKIVRDKNHEMWLDLKDTLLLEVK